MNSSPDVPGVYFPPSLDGRPGRGPTGSAGPSDWCPPELSRLGPVRPTDRPGEPSAAAGSSAAGVDIEIIREHVWREGFVAGQDEVMAELRQGLTAMKLAAEALVAARTPLLTDLTGNLTAVALAAARHLVGREISLDPSLVTDLVSRGIDMVKPDSPITIRMNPEDMRPVQEELDPGLAHDAMSVRWLADPAIARGGYVLESPNRLIDGRIDEGLRLLYERIVHE